MKNLFVIIALSVFHVVNGQRNTNGYWQQHVDYTMEVKMDVENFNYSGKQQLIYTNNSPDTLQNVFSIYISMLFSLEVKWTSAPELLQIPIVE